MGEIVTSWSGTAETVLVAVVPPDLTHETADELRETVRRELGRRESDGVVLDMAEVRLISSIGIAALLQVLEICQDGGVDVILADLPETQHEFLRMLKLDRKFRTHSPLQDAVASLSSERD